LANGVGFEQCNFDIAYEQTLMDQSVKYLQESLPEWPSEKYTKFDVTDKAIRSDCNVLTTFMLDHYGNEYDELQYIQWLWDADENCYNAVRYILKKGYNELFCPKVYIGDIDFYKFVIELWKLLPFDVFANLKIDNLQVPTKEDIDGEMKDGGGIYRLNGKFMAWIKKENEIDPYTHTHTNTHTHIHTHTYIHTYTHTSA